MGVGASLKNWYVGVEESFTNRLLCSWGEFDNLVIFGVGQSLTNWLLRGRGRV
jgi:hypothetical protein